MTRLRANTVVDRTSSNVANSGAGSPTACDAAGNVEPVLSSTYPENNEPKSMASDAKNSQMPSRTVVVLVSGLTS